MPGCQKAEYGLSYILKVTFPLILSALTSTLMMSIDRFVVSQLSVQAMNALSIAGSYVSVGVCFVISISSISTVFVGQYNGSCQHDKIAQPVWQMLYFSVIVGFICLPFALYPEMVCFLPDMYRDIGIGYQGILTGFMWIPAAYSAVSGFFIGRGKTTLVTVVAIMANILNFLLDILLVFGVKDLIPAYGVSGAAIATVVSNFAGFLVLLGVFLNNSNRENFYTNRHNFNKSTFFDCIKIGLPMAADRVFNLGAWSLIFVLLGKVSDDLATLESVTISVYVVLCCYTEGINKGAASIISNLIGNKMESKINQVFKHYMVINVIFALLISIPLVFCQDILFFFLGKMNGDVSHLHSEFAFVFYALSAIIFFDGIMWMLSGILAAGGDTMWPAVVNTVLVWGMIVVPTAYMYFNGTLDSVREINSLSGVTSLLTAVLYYIRFKKGKWIKRIVDQG